MRGPAVQTDIMVELSKRRSWSNSMSTRTKKLHKQYKIQRTPSVNASPWFEKALSGNWAESNDKKVVFRDVDPTVMEYFLYYLMRGEIGITVQSQQNELLYSQQDELTAVRLCVFADKHFLPKLQNHAMNYLHAVMGRTHNDRPYTCINTIAEALEASTPGSPLYRFKMAVLTTGLNNGSVYEDTRGSIIHMGKYTSEEVVVLERIPGVMTTLLFQSMLGGKSAPRRLRLEELLVEEN